MIPAEAECLSDCYGAFRYAARVASQHAPVLPELQHPSPSDRPGQDARPVPRRPAASPATTAVQVRTPKISVPSSGVAASQAISVRRASGLPLAQNRPQTAFGSHLAVGTVVLGRLCVLPGRQRTFSKSSTAIWTGNCARHGAARHAWRTTKKTAPPKRCRLCSSGAREGVGQDLVAPEVLELQAEDLGVAVAVVKHAGQRATADLEIPLVVDVRAEH